MSKARQMKSFEDQKYEEWKQNVEQHLPSLLKRNLLIKPHHAAEEMRAAAQKEADEAGMFVHFIKLNYVFDNLTKYMVF